MDIIESDTYLRYGMFYARRKPRKFPGHRMLKSADAAMDDRPFKKWKVSELVSNRQFSWYLIMKEARFHIRSNAGNRASRTSTLAFGERVDV